MAQSQMLHAQVSLMFDMKRSGAQAVAEQSGGVRGHIHNFLNTDLAPDRSEIELTDYIKNSGLYAQAQIDTDPNSPHGLPLPLMEGEEDNMGNLITVGVTDLVEAAGKSLAEFISTDKTNGDDVEVTFHRKGYLLFFGASGNARQKQFIEDLVGSVRLEHDYTCKQRVWDRDLERWVWEYNYTLIEIQSASGLPDRLLGTAVSVRLLKQLRVDGVDLDTIFDLAPLAPTYRLACVVNGRSV